MRFAALLTVILIPTIAQAQIEKSLERDNIQDALRGLTTVDLVVEAFGELPDPVAFSETLKRRLELRLRPNGIRAGDDPSKAATLPRLHLTAYVVRSDDFKHYAYDVRLTVSRMVQMPVPTENRNMDIRAIVWHKSLLSLAPAGNTSKLRDASEELTRALISDFLAANPKPR